MSVFKIDDKQREREETTSKCFLKYHQLKEKYRDIRLKQNVFVAFVIKLRIRVTKTLQKELPPSCKFYF